jgi:hypothetical protein
LRKPERLAEFCDFCAVGIHKRHLCANAYAMQDIFYAFVRIAFPARWWRS